MTVNNSHRSAFFIPVIMAFIITGCSPSDKTADVSVNKVNNIEKVASASIEKVDANSQLKFAPTVDEDRTGLWLGGSPPINKRASGIDTYYRMSVGSKPNRLLVTLQFEGVKADDAFFYFKGLDGAEVALAQPVKWLLKANVVSEVTFEVKVPDTVSYLTLYTFQNGRGAARAFKLEPTKHL